jgi:intein/homing endonuclease
LKIILGRVKLVDIRLATGDVITATGGHPFFDADLNQWLDASELSEGNALMMMWAIKRPLPTLMV